MHAFQLCITTRNSKLAENPSHRQISNTGHWGINCDWSELRRLEYDFSMVEITKIDTRTWTRNRFPRLQQLELFHYRPSLSSWQRLVSSWSKISQQIMKQSWKILKVSQNQVILQKWWKLLFEQVFRKKVWAGSITEIFLDFSTIQCFRRESRKSRSSTLAFDQHVELIHI